MKKIWKIILIIVLILLIIFFVVSGVIAYTIYQGYQVKEKIDNFSAKAVSLKEDCSNVEEVKTALYDLKKEITDSCKNPILKSFAEKNLQEGICEQEKREEYARLILEEIEKKCPSPTI